MFSTVFGLMIALYIVKSYGSKLRSPPLRANCNPNAVSVQCAQVAKVPLGTSMVQKFGAWFLLALR